MLTFWEVSFWSSKFWLSRLFQQFGRIILIFKILNIQYLFVSVWYYVGINYTLFVTAFHILRLLLKCINATLWSCGTLAPLPCCACHWYVSIIWIIIRCAFYHKSVVFTIMVKSRTSITDQQLNMKFLLQVGMTIKQMKKVTCAIMIFLTLTCEEFG